MRKWICGVVAGLVIAIAGCGKSEQRVTLDGAVQVRGKALTAGIVQVFGTGDRLATAQVRIDGTFTVTDVFTGPVRVAVVPGFNPRSMPPPVHPAGVTLPPAPATPPPAEPIPSRYADPATSGLNFTISGPADRLDLRLDD